MPYDEQPFNEYITELQQNYTMDNSTRKVLNKGLRYLKKIGNILFFMYLIDSSIDFSKSMAVFDFYNLANPMTEETFKDITHRILKNQKGDFKKFGALRSEDISSTTLNFLF